MSDLIEKVKKTINNNNLITPGDRVVLAVSGGPDSICMLDVLYKIYSNNIFAVAHINHMIRKEAGEDEIFVKNYCEKLGIPFYSKSIDVQKIASDKKIGLEEAGRIARYDFFEEVASMVGANKIAIAHNKNDSVETVIMHALRGSGTKGLEGIQPKNGKYIRPLINCERTEIEQYCIDNNIAARIDKTNLENVYTRNKIRNIAIPYIKEEFNPNVIETISRLSSLIKEENDYIDNQVEKIYKEIVIKDISKELVDDCIEKVHEKFENTINIEIAEENNLDDNQTSCIILDLKKFNLQEKVIKSRLVLYTINRLFGTTKGIEKIHIEDIIKLCQNNVGNKFLTPNKSIKIYVKARENAFFEIINLM